MIKIATVVGARPQFIKAATVSRVLADHSGVQEILVHTGQHYDENMSGRFFEELSLPQPAYSLHIGSGTHGVQTGRMLAAIEEVLLAERPDWVLVYGDTNSTLAGALAAAKLHIPVAHVEAGLRSFNRRMPEEINRITTDHLSTLLCTPTRHASAQLEREGVAPHQVIETGDVMYDATLFYNECNTRRQTLVETLGLTPQSYALVTLHRAENTDCPVRLRHICEALTAFAREQRILLPLHPRTAAALACQGLLDNLKQVLTVLEPAGYLDMLALERDAALIITDSGGVQKEAYFNQVPCITLRDETEWVELVDAGVNRLCSPEQEFCLQEKTRDFDRKGFENTHLYGRGNAAECVVNALLGAPMV